MNLRVIILTILALTALSARADVALEQYGQLTLDAIPDHGLVVNTFEHNALVFNADTQEMLGMLSLGMGANAVEIDRKKGLIHVAETYLSRHTRGQRTDVVTTYALATLSAVSEIVIPPKHASGSPMRHYSGIVRDESGNELMLVMNITPAVTISVVDLASGKFLGELGTAGCGLVYPASGLSFLQICGDGTAQLIKLKADGTEIERIRSKSFFDLQADPLMEKAVKTANGWLFNTFKGEVFRVSVVDDAITATKLFTVNDESGPWRIGGMQPLAFHAKNELLLALVNQGAKDNHKNPGTEVWYYNLTSGERIHRLALKNPASSIQVSQDDKALLYGASLFTSEIDIYDLKTGQLKGSISDVSLPTILQNL